MKHFGWLALLDVIWRGPVVAQGVASTKLKLNTVQDFVTECPNVPTKEYCFGLIYGTAGHMTAPDQFAATSN